MKNSEIIARAVADAAGLPLGAVKVSLAAVVEGLPPGHRFNEERPQAEAEQLLAALRQEMEGIRQWFLQGYLDAVANGYPPFPLDNAGRWKKKGHNPKGKGTNRAGYRPRPGGNRRR